MIGRRAVIVSLAACAATGAGAQPAGGRRRIGVLMPYSADDAVTQARLAGFRVTLAGLGWVNGASVEFDERWATDNLDRVREAAAELAEARVDVILTTGSRIVPIVQRATATIPIIFVGVSDPVGQGLVTSLARPGNNTTGFSLLEFDGERSPLMNKLFEIMLELSPGLARAAIMFNPANPAHRFHARTFKEAASRLQIEAVEARISGLADIEMAIAAFARTPGGVMLLPSDLTLLGNRDRIVELMARYRLPAIYSDRSFVEAGGLCSYSADRSEMFKRAAEYANRILRGERVGDLPVQQPTRYEFVIHLATVRTLGISLPTHVLARADEVIE